jgi:hypothetical protein
MQSGKLFLLISVLLWPSACETCLADPCIQNEFAIHAGQTNSVGNTTGNKVSDLIASGPCTVDIGAYSCVLSKGCEDVAIVGIGDGVCHLEGRATITGSFSIDVHYVSCILRCGGRPNYVTNHVDVFLSDGAALDAGTSGDSEGTDTSRF